MFYYCKESPIKDIHDFLNLPNHNQDEVFIEERNVGDTIRKIKIFYEESPNSKYENNKRICLSIKPEDEIPKICKYWIVLSYIDDQIVWDEALETIEEVLETYNWLFEEENKK